MSARRAFGPRGLALAAALVAAACVTRRGIETDTFRLRVTVTRDGRPVAVILSPEDPAELEETISVLSDPQALPDIREADAASATGDVVRGVDAVRALRP